MSTELPRTPIPALSIQGNHLYNGRQLLQYAMDALAMRASATQRTTAGVTLTLVPPPFGDGPLHIQQWENHGLTAGTHQLFSVAREEHVGRCGRAGGCVCSISAPPGRECCSYWVKP